MKHIRKKIILSSRNYRLNIPSLLIKGLGWADDIVNIEVDPEENKIIISNLKRKPVGLTNFSQNIENAKWIRNKKKYNQILNENLSPEGREISHGTKWSEVDDGGYWNIKLGVDFVLELEKQIKDAPHELKYTLKGIQSSCRAHNKALLKYLEDKHKDEDAGKKPAWFKKIEKEIKKY